MEINTLYTKALHWFYGIPGQMEQEERLVLDRFGNGAFLSLLAAMGVSLLLSLFLDIDVFDDAVFCTLLVVLYRKERLVHKLGLHFLHIRKADLAWARRKMFVRTLYQTASVVLLVLAVSWLLWKWGIPQEHGVSASVHFGFSMPVSLVLWTLGGFGVAYWTNQKRILVDKA